MRKFFLVFALLTLALFAWPSTASAGVCTPRLGHGVVVKAVAHAIASGVACRLHGRPVVREVAVRMFHPFGGRFAFRRCGR